MPPSSRWLPGAWLVPVAAVLDVVIAIAAFRAHLRYAPLLGTIAYFVVIAGGCVITDRLAARATRAPKPAPLPRAHVVTMPRRGPDAEP